MPVTIGLKAATRSPRAARAAQIEAATTVLPTPVSVPVTNSPRTAGTLGRVGEAVEDAGAGVRLGGGRLGLERASRGSLARRLRHCLGDDLGGVAQLGLGV